MSLNELLTAAGVTPQQKDIEISEELLLEHVDEFRDLINY